MRIYELGGATHKLLVSFLTFGHAPSTNHGLPEVLALCECSIYRWFLSSLRSFVSRNGNGALVILVWQGVAMAGFQCGEPFQAGIRNLELMQALSEHGWVPQRLERGEEFISAMGLLR